MKLNDDEKRLISKKIENLEKSSSAELVAVFTQRSSEYKYISLLLSISLLFFISVVLVLFFTKSINLLEIQLLIFAFIMIFFDFISKFIIKLLPKSYKYNKASQNAQNQFFNLGLNRTQTRQGIMFFVSYEEKYAQIICDEAISKKIPNKYWQNIIDEFIKDVKQDELSKGYLKAIQSCSEILIKEFPIQKDDKNELPNEVIEIKQ